MLIRGELQPLGTGHLKLMAGANQIALDLTGELRHFRFVDLKFILGKRVPLLLMDSKRRLNLSQSLLLSSVNGSLERLPKQALCPFMDRIDCSHSIPNQSCQFNEAFFQLSCLAMSRHIDPQVGRSCALLANQANGGHSAQNRQSQTQGDKRPDHMKTLCHDWCKQGRRADFPYFVGVVVGKPVWLS